jgi:hypothetical protein
MSEQTDNSELLPKQTGHYMNDSIDPRNFDGALTSGMFGRGVCVTDGDKYTRVRVKRVDVSVIEMEGGHVETHTIVSPTRCPALGRCALCPNA